jgi:hypothetical protein
MPIKIEVVTTPAPPAPHRLSSTIQISSLTTNTNGMDNNNTTTTTTSNNDNNNTGAGIVIAPHKLMPIVVIVPPEEAAKEAMRRPSEQQQQRFRPSITKKQLEHEAASTISMAGPIMDRIKAGNAHARKTDRIRSSLSLSSHSSSHSSTGTSCSSSRSIDGVDEDGTTTPVVVKVFQRKSKDRKKNHSLRNIRKKVSAKNY